MGRSNGRRRVIQWTTGRTGSAAVRGMVGHPELEIVGCYAWSADKVGRDVGELCGVGPLGVLATDDVDALLSLEPDCVVYTPYRPDFDHVVRILESGCNVVTTMYMFAGEGYGLEATQRVAAAAEAGNASLYASGIYPGYAPNMALAATAMSSRVDRISVLESLDMSGYAHEKMFRAMGIDLLPDDPEAASLVERACGSFRDQVAVMASALAADLDEIAFRAEFAVAEDDLDFGYMTIRKGHIAGIKGTIAGIVGGVSRIECNSVWKMGDAMTPNWPVESGYVVEVDGDPSFRFRIEPTGEHFDGASTTAMPVVHAIGSVCEAPAGIVNQVQLPFVCAAHKVTA